MSHVTFTDLRNNLATHLPLRNEMSVWWSRRITAEHRLVYRVAGKGETQAVEIASCRYHYDRR